MTKDEYERRLGEITTIYLDTTKAIERIYGKTAYVCYAICLLAGIIIGLMCKVFYK